MHLTFRSTFLSVKQFPEIDLPPFVLITGLNGTGKSHVLKAIKEGNISCDVTSNPKEEIRLHDWQTLMPQDAGTYDGRTWMQQRSGVRDHVINQARTFSSQILDVAMRHGVPSEHLKDIAYVSLLSTEDLTQILGDRQKAEAAKEAIRIEANNASQNIRSQVRNNHQYTKSIEYILKRTSKPLVALDSQDFFYDGEERWGSAELFQQSLAQAFVAYRDLALKNELRIRARERGREVEALSDEEFIARHMIAPWSFVNEAMKAAHLDFEIDHPDLDDYIPYRPQLTKRSSGAHIFFSDLSSGEKILMSLALSLYQTNDKRQLTTYPKVLLLDEIDAPLHPSMSRFYLEVLTKTIVEKNGISVIATTHSPSTVAIAPEESIYVIRPDVPGLHKITKSQALNILTQGVPTLAISFEGRRQVFVESYSDAELYDVLSQNLKQILQTERSLEFVATGVRNPENHTHTNMGCAVVRHLVETLSKAGNKSVFGLIDWDGKNTPNERIHVLAYDRRNGIENVILDPLVLSAFIAGYDRDSAAGLGISRETTYLNFFDLKPEELQPIIDQLQQRVLKKTASEKAKCKYVGGFELEIDDSYLKLDDHSLEKAVLDAFPALNKYTRNRNGALMMEIATTVLKDKPSFIPIEIRDAFLGILNIDSH